MNEVNEFLNKIENQEYISKKLYDSIKVNNFDLEKYNDKILEMNYNKYKSYFENMYNDIDKSIHLDKEQIKTILADEDSLLVIAGAGTGKTTTMVSKVKYLVDIKKVDPKKIIVISYTKKATEELAKKINIDFEIPAKVTTFHSLGLMHIRQIFNNHKIYIVDNNKQEEIFLEYFQEVFKDKKKMQMIIDTFEDIPNQNHFVFGKYFKENWRLYPDFDSYFESYKRYKLSEIKNLDTWIKEKIERDLNNDEKIITINGEYVKSKGEGLIANFLFTNNIEYYYEKIYDKLMEDNKVYRPDFTLNLGDELIYIEYFGLSNYKNDELHRYEKIRKLKENYHRQNKTKFIALDYEPRENMLEKLKKELEKYGFKLKPKENIEIYDAIKNRNKLSTFYPLKKIMFKVIETIKSSVNRQDYYNIALDYIESLSEKEKLECLKELNIFNEFYKLYQEKLYGSQEYGFDYSDMIYYANMYLDKLSDEQVVDCSYIIIDEYQDISESRYNLTKNIANRNHAKVIAVGDDWQSIYSFAGSKISYISNFTKYFPNSKILSINKTYRNSQELIDYSGAFIMKNDSQIKKDLISDKSINKPIIFKTFSKDVDKYYTFNNEIKALKDLIKEIHAKNPDHKILILARNNDVFKNLFKTDLELKDGIDTKIIFEGINDIDIDGMSIHKSKGLTSDEVIIFGLYNSFPSLKTNLFWLESLFIPTKENEPIDFAEERRVFYVALTRTKNSVYLLVNEDPKYQSPFVIELYNIIKSINQTKLYNIIKSVNQTTDSSPKS